MAWSEEMKSHMNLVLLLVCLVSSDAVSGLCWNESDGILKCDSNPTAADLKRAALSGNAEAQFMMGEREFNGTIWEARDFVAAGRWYKLAANQGHHEAEEAMGMFFSGGLGGFPVSCATSIEWYEKAIEGNCAIAWSNLAWKLSTCEDEKLRDGARALSILRDQADRIEDKAALLDNKAAANAAMGDFSIAEKLQLAAIGLLAADASPKRVKSYQTRLALYKAHRTWSGASFSFDVPDQASE